MHHPGDGGVFRRQGFKLSNNPGVVCPDGCHLIAENCSDENKYIQSATLNGKELNQPWFNHSDIANGGKLVLKMGDKANKAWGSDLKNVPPSAKSL